MIYALCLKSTKYLQTKKIIQSCSTKNPYVCTYISRSECKHFNKYFQQSKIPQQTVSSNSFGIPPPCCNEYMVRLLLANVSAKVRLCEASNHKLPNSNVGNLAEWVTRTEKWAGWTVLFMHPTHKFTWQYLKNKYQGKILRIWNCSCALQFQ